MPAGKDEDDDASMLANETAEAGAGDVLGDELLELAEGEEDSLALGLRGGFEGNLETLTAEELGIQERLAADSDQEEAKAFESVLVKARRAWAKEVRERERTRRLRDTAREKETARETGNGVSIGNGIKRSGRTDDYDSDSNSEDEARADVSTKRQRMSEQNGSGDVDREREKEEAARRTARNRYLVEKAKLRFLRDENERMWSEIRHLEAEEKHWFRQSRKALESALVYELG